MGMAGLYSIGSRFLEDRLQTLNRVALVLLGQLLSLEHGIDALDGADANPRGGVERVGGQPLDDVLLAEL